jgi:hypothetical protein
VKEERHRGDKRKERKLNGEDKNEKMKMKMRTRTRTKTKNKEKGKQVNECE